MSQFDLRITRLNAAPVSDRGRFVLYWMIAQRRPTYNFALQYAAMRARELECPLVVLEPLRCDYRWASDRFHRFVLDGMADNHQAFAKTTATYIPYVEPEHGAGKGLLRALSAHACEVVTDEFPCFMLPRMAAAAASQLSVRLTAVDGNGLLPLRAVDKAYTLAHVFRRTLQRELPRYLLLRPLARPLSSLRPPKVSLPTKKIINKVLRDYPSRTDQLIDGTDSLSTLPIDHRVAAIAQRGGYRAAQRTWRAFLKQKLARYCDDRNKPEAAVESRLSGYLHFGHISPHQVFDELMDQCGWSIDRIGPKPTGSREGWWGAPPEVEAFIDQLVTWREVGYNVCHFEPAYDDYQSLPAWARATLEKHTKDPREHVYSLDQFAAAGTHDPLWNATQRQLIEEGRVHGYLRMLWGKKILEWTRDPQQALAVMIELNNRYAIDGRNPNSYNGIFWVMGRFDRAWGPERPIFGKVRYMSSANTARKVRVRQYIERFS